MPYIVHISSVHNAGDPRIRRREIGSIIAAGWRAALVTGDLRAEPGGGIKIIPVPPGNSSRAKRVIITSPLAVLRALRENADIYHIHDPELLPWAWILRFKGKPVVYDIHEDYSSSIRQKPYLPSFIRPAAAWLATALERALSCGMHRVLAEKYYERRFPDGFPLLNFPSLSMAGDGLAFAPDSKRLLYTGNVTEARGALHMARLVRAKPEFTLVAAGYCPSRLALAMRRAAGAAADRLDLRGVGRFVPFEEIIGLYRQGGWLAGLALFPDTGHYREKHLTKFFEYMASGLPVVASGFPAWRSLIEGQGAGICVNSEDPESVAEALDRLRLNPREALAMAERGRRLVKTCCNWEHEGERLIGFYRNLSSLDMTPAGGNG
jgi:glycosyltransferase involved in cell wall biosynthesis